MQPRAGLFEILNTLKSRGIKMGIITNGQTEVQKATISALCMGNRMDVVIVSEEAGIRKPAPGIFQLALVELGLDAESVWYVGDHAVNDVIGASDAGLAGVWLNVDGDWPSAHPQPLFEIRSLPELIELLPS
jgi:putative hydrolase of the HAD superfamily